MKAKIYKTNGEIKEIEPENGTDFTLKKTTRNRKRIHRNNPSKKQPNNSHKRRR